MSLYPFLFLKNHCFEQIHKFITESSNKEEEENEFILFSLPNAIRKCLEIFIKFKNPKEGNLSVLDNYLKEHNKSHLKEFLNNIYNDGSHALIIGGRNYSNTKNPAEIKEVAKVVYDILKQDQEHFDNICNLFKNTN